MSTTPKLPSLPVERLLETPRAVAGGVPEGLDALLLGELARAAASGRRKTPTLHVARDANRLATLEEALRFFAPDIEVLSFPAWDGVPYDRAAPNAETIARRISTLAELTNRAADEKKPLVVLTTVNAIVQRVPPRDFISGSSLNLQPGDVINVQALIERLEISGYGRAGNVTDPVRHCMERIAKHNMILATGHVGRQEIFAIVKEAKKMGLKKVLVTHAEFPSQSLTGDEQKALVEEGAMIEHCFTTTYTNKAPWETAFANIRKSGVANTVVSTDLGQTINPPVAEGFANTALSLGDFAVAEKGYRETLSREPGSGRAYFGLAAALTGLGKSEDAADVRVR